MKYKSIKVFSWFDVMHEICKKLDISSEEFRDYEVSNLTQVDLWHEWINYFQEIPGNDVVLRCEMDERISSKKDWVTKDGKKFLIPFVEAIYKVWDEQDIEFISYSW